MSCRIAIICSSDPEAEGGAAAAHVGCVEGVRVPACPLHAHMGPTGILDERARFGASRNSLSWLG